jgi:anti-anti-sigma regulatory factor
LPVKVWNQTARRPPPGASSNSTLQNRDELPVTTVVIDLSGLSFCDVAGFRALADLCDAQQAATRSLQIVDPRYPFRHHT